MVASGDERVIPQRKLDYRKKLEDLLVEYKNILVVTVDNVGSNQMQQIRKAVRGKAAVLLGKNTIIRKVMRAQVKTNPGLEKLIPLIVGNIGLVFTNNNIKEIRDTIVEFKVPAAARVGTSAPADVHIPPGPTGLDPGQTAFFQALNIMTKIVKGSIEIVNSVHLIHVGDKITPSMVSLLSKLNIKPFFYGVKAAFVYDNGSLYESSILDIDPNALLARFLDGVTRLTALSLQIGIPNLATVPHSLARAFKKILALAVTTEIDFKEAAPFKEFLANPAAYYAKHGGGGGAAPAASSSSSSGAAAAKVEAAPAKKEESESDDVGAGFSLFGDD